MDNHEYSHLKKDAIVRATQLNLRVKQIEQNPALRGPWAIEVHAPILASLNSEFNKLQLALIEPIDVPLIAWRARNLLELKTWTASFLQSEDNSKRFYADASRDFLSVLKAFEDWANKKEIKLDFLTGVEDKKTALLNSANSKGINSLDGSYKDVRHAAQESGMSDHFSVLHKALSKFVHPTAMQVMTAWNEDMALALKETLFGVGCLMFHSAIEDLEKLLLGNTVLNDKKSA